MEPTCASALIWSRVTGRPARVCKLLSSCFDVGMEARESGTAGSIEMVSVYHSTSAAPDCGRVNSPGA